MSDKNLNLPREQYEPVISQSMELDALNAELTLSVFDIHGFHDINTCYGEVLKIVDALMDYAKLLEMACDTWDLQGFHRASYELRAEKLREIARKYQAGIGYDYDAAMEKCKKRTARKDRDDEPGGEAMAMAFRKSRQMAEAKAKKAAEKDGTIASVTADSGHIDPPWEEDE